MAFAPREIARVESHGQHIKIRLFGLGLLGPQGALPLHATEIAQDRNDRRKDSTLVDFLDIFHHRWMTLFYRAWAQAQATAGLDRPGEESFSRYVGWLSGIAPATADTESLPTHARLAAASHLLRGVRHGDGLAATLSHYLGLPVHVEPCVLHWINVDDNTRSRMASSNAAARLGRDAINGTRVPDRQSKFRLVFGPLELEQYLALLPGGAHVPAVVDWVRAFTGFEYLWEIELRLKPPAVVPAVAGGAARMGWSAWLGHPPHAHSVTGLVYEPELHRHAFSPSCRCHIR